MILSNHKKIAAIDVGTNTVLLLVAEISDATIHPLYQQEQIVRLGEGVDKTQRIKPEAMQRTLHALKEYVKITRDFHVETILIAGTSALRDAQNRQEFLQLVHQELGISIRVLSGKEEAELTYWGALSNKQHLQGKIMLMDIGGGSTEFVSGNINQIDHFLSLDIGSVRLTERFIHHDPAAEEEIKSISNIITTQLKQLKYFNQKHDYLVGVAGTVTTLAAIQQKLEPYLPEKVDGSRLKLDDVKQLVDLLKGKTLEERKLLPGLNPNRADVILAGALILLESMKYFELDEILVSDRGLRFGLIWEYLKTLYS